MWHSEIIFLNDEDPCIIFGFMSCSKLSTLQKQWLLFSSILEKEAGRHKKCSGVSAAHSMYRYTRTHTQPQTSTVFKLNIECFQGRSCLSTPQEKKAAVSLFCISLCDAPSGAALQQPNHHCLAMDTWASYFYSKFKFTHIISNALWSNLKLLLLHRVTRNQRY